MELSLESSRKSANHEQSGYFCLHAYQQQTSDFHGQLKNGSARLPAPLAPAHELEVVAKSKEGKGVRRVGTDTRRWERCGDGCGCVCESDANSQRTDKADREPRLSSSGGTSTLRPLLARKKKRRGRKRHTLGEPRLAAGRLAQHASAGAADDDRLRVREDGGDGKAAGALDVHEVRVGRLHEPLELVRALLRLRERVEQVDGERLKWSVMRRWAGWIGRWIEDGEDGGWMAGRRRGRTKNRVTNQYNAPSPSPSLKSHTPFLRQVCQQKQVLLSKS